MRLLCRVSAIEAYIMVCYTYSLEVEMLHLLCVMKDSDTST